MTAKPIHWIHQDHWFQRHLLKAVISTGFVTGQVRLHYFPQTTVQNFLDNGI
jgi:hypothetical protein